MAVARPYRSLILVMSLLLMITFSSVVEAKRHNHEHGHHGHHHRRHHHHGHHKNHGHGNDNNNGHGQGGNLKPSDCKPKCTYRCSATSHKKPCMFFCQKCCATCLCVPPGTYGNKQVCPCYNNWKTKRGGPKCP